MLTIHLSQTGEINSSWFFWRKFLKGLARRTRRSQLYFIIPEIKANPKLASGPPTSSNCVVRFTQSCSNVANRARSIPKSRNKERSGFGASGMPQTLLKSLSESQGIGLLTYLAQRQNAKYDQKLASGNEVRDRKGLKGLWFSNTTCFEDSVDRNKRQQFGEAFVPT